MRRNIYDLRLAQSGATLHHIGLLMQAEETRCAWCDAESGRKPSMTRIESHGICVTHLAGLKRSLQEHRMAT